MNRYRSLLVLAMVVLSLALISPAAAQPGKPNRPNRSQSPQPRVTWSISRLQQTVSPGQTVQVNVTLTSSMDVTDVSLVMPSELGTVLRVEPASFSQLSAGVATNVRLTISMPADGNRNYAGTIQVRTGERSVPNALKVHVRVPR